MARPDGWDVVGFGDDPVPGDRWEISSLARTYKKIGDAADEASDMLTTIKSSGGLEGWDSDAGDVFKDNIEDLPKDLGKVATSYLALYGVLDSWSGTVEETQHKADAALAEAKSAKQDLDAAAARLEDAQSDYQTYDTAYSGLKKDFDKYKDDDDAPADAPKDYQVTAAANNRSVAAGKVSDAEGDVSEANARIAAAKKLVKEAHGDWEDAEESTAKKVGEAADAGLGKQHWWDKVFGSEIWDTIIEICKVIVAIGGIIVLIIGGPLAWVVFAAALLVLADTLYKMSQGTAGFGDLIFALLDCIPGAKGITSLAKLGKAAAEGITVGAKFLKVGGQLASDSKAALKGLTTSLKKVKLNDINPTGKTLADMPNKGEFGEAQTKALMDMAGLKVVSQAGHNVNANGIDLIVTDGKTLFIVESKYVGDLGKNGSQSLKLLKSVDANGDRIRQMSEPWIDARLDDALDVSKLGGDAAAKMPKVSVVTTIRESGTVTTQIVDGAGKPTGDILQAGSSGRLPGLDDLGRGAGAVTAGADAKGR